MADLCTEFKLQPLPLQARTLKYHVPLFTVMNVDVFEPLYIIAGFVNDEEVDLSN